MGVLTYGQRLTGPGTIASSAAGSGRRSSTGGLLLLLIGSLGLIGFLTGQLDRWLAYLFTPPAGATGTTNLTGPVGGSGGLGLANTGQPPVGGVPAVSSTNRRGGGTSSA